MGRIGQKIAKIAKSLGMIIHYHNRSKLSDDKEQGAIYHENLKDFFKETNSLTAKKILENFEMEINKFKQVCPIEMLDKLDNPITLKSKIKKAS